MAYPKPHQTFNYMLNLTKISPGVYTENFASEGATIYDVADGSGDNLTQLGDISNDHFDLFDSVIKKPYTGVYLGRTSDDKAVFFSFNGSVYAVSNYYNPKKTLTLQHAVFDIPCFASGTMIRTARGDVPVETLEVGDLVIDASGKPCPVRWLGHRTVDCRRHPSPRKAMPIRVAAHAFGPSRPARELYLSPGHSVCVDLVGEILVPVGCLVNGATIVQVDVDEVTYWHVELERHDILLAENLPCESYLDCGNRAFFAESHVVDLAAGPDAPAPTTDAPPPRPTPTRPAIATAWSSRPASASAPPRARKTSPGA